jgi:hypothetical protein
MGEVINAFKRLFGNLKGIDHVEGLGGRLKLILKK